MTALKKITPLRLHGDHPCDESIKWLSAHPIWTMADAWTHCPRADWMIWLLRASGQSGRHTFELKVLALEAADRALRRCKRLGIETDPRSWAAVRVGFAFLRGQATREDIRAANVAANAAADDAAATAYAGTAYAAYATAAYAAYATADAAATAAYAAYATAATAAYATDAAAATATDDAAAAAATDDAAAATATAAYAATAYADADDEAAAADAKSHELRTQADRLRQLIDVE